MPASIDMAASMLRSPSYSAAARGGGSQSPRGPRGVPATRAALATGGRVDGRRVREEVRWWVGDNDGQSTHQYKYQVFIRRVDPDARLVLSHEEIASILYDHLQFPEVVIED